MLIKVDLLKINKISTKGFSHYAINGCQIEQKGEDCSICATDGRRVLLAQWHSELDKTPDFRVIIAAPILDNVLKAAHKQELYFNGKVFSFINSTINVESLDGSFPDFEKYFLKEPGSVSTIEFRPRLFYSLLKIMGDLIDDSGVEFIMGNGSDSPIIIKGKTDTGIKLTGLIMPLKSKN